MASSSSTTTTQDKDQDTHTTLKLSLKKEKTTKIQWTEDTVDNEGGFYFFKSSKLYAVIFCQKIPTLYFHLPFDDLVCSHLTFTPNIHILRAGEEEEQVLLPVQEGQEGFGGQF